MREPFLHFVGESHFADFTHIFYEKAIFYYKTMSQYLQVTEDENEEPIEVPTEENGTLLLTTLTAQFPGACGLKYRNVTSGSMRGVRLADGCLHPPDGFWDTHLYVVVYPKESNGAENKRKGEDGLEKPLAKTKRVEKLKCTDLIVLGLPWKSSEDELSSYFSKFGELLMVQVKKDLKTGQSKGFGFIRFAEYESQKRCLSQRHMIEGRWCDVKIPSSKHDGTDVPTSRKLFVGRCTEDMTTDDIREFFSSFGEVVDVFIPKPFRAFAFVTFAEPEVAQSLCGEDFIIKGTSIRCSSAAPKGFGFGNSVSESKQHRNSNWNRSGGFGGGSGGWGGGYGKNDMGSNKSMGNVGGGEMGQNPLEYGGFGAAFNQAVMAAAQAALQGGWGMMGMNNQSGMGGGQGGMGNQGSMGSQPNMGGQGAMGRDNNMGNYSGVSPGKQSGYPPSATGGSGFNTNYNM